MLIGVVSFKIRNNLFKFKGKESTLMKFEYITCSFVKIVFTNFSQLGIVNRVLGKLCLYFVRKHSPGEDHK